MPKNADNHMKAVAKAKRYASNIGKAARWSYNKFKKAPKAGKVAIVAVGATGYAAARSYNKYLRGE